MLRKKASIIIILLIAGVLFAPQCLAEKIGVIADIHAGSKEVRNKNKYTPGNIVYPRKYKTYFRRVLAQLKDSGVQKVLALGDQTDAGKDKKRAKNLVSLAKQAGMEMIWVRGNHESRSATKKIFFPDGLLYYEQELDDWKIIILDTNENLSLVNGGIKEKQLQWLEEKISGTEKNILIAMHHPIFRIREELPDRIASNYQEFEELISASGKVKYVLAGHVHPKTLFEKKLHDVQYYILPPLTIKGNLGYHMVLDLE